MDEKQFYFFFQLVVKKKGLNSVFGRKLRISDLQDHLNASLSKIPIFEFRKKTSNIEF